MLAELTLLGEVEKYELTIEPEFGAQTVKTMLVDTMGAEVSVPIDEALYLADTGTLDYPALNWLGDLYAQVEQRFYQRVCEIADMVMDGGCDAQDLTYQFRVLEIQLNSFVQAFFDEKVNSSKSFNVNSGSETSLVPLELFKQSIVCKISKIL